MSRETHRTRHRADAAIREKRPEKCKVFPGMMANLNSSFGRSGVRQKRVKRCEADVDVDVSPGRAQRRGGELVGRWLCIVIGHGGRETMARGENVINPYIYYYCARIIEAK